MIRAFAIVLATAALATGCDEDEHTWNPQALGASVGSLVEDFDAHAAEVDELWERSPVLLAGEFLRLDRAEASRTRVESQAQGEGTGPATVTVTLEGLFDDSVFAERYTLQLERAGAVWRLESAAWAQRCASGRGHGDYSPEPCI